MRIDFKNNTLLARRNRLKEFDLVFRSGRYVSTHDLSLNYFLPANVLPEAPNHGIHLAVITPKKLGDAHIRNKIRRQILHAFQRDGIAKYKGVKAAVLVKKDFVGLDTKTRHSHIAGLIGKFKTSLGILA